MNTGFSQQLPPLALIAGPTASGKSALAIRLAELVDGIVINADASQVYKDIPIISAQPSQEDRARAPHRLFGHVDGSEACSAAHWAADAREAIAVSWRAGRIPILTGGTGLYIRTLLDGIAPIPPIDPAIRAEVRALGTEDAYRALAAEDPVAAARLRPSDTARIARALEVVRSTGRPIDRWHEESTGGIGGSLRLVPSILLPSRDWLHARVRARFDAMLADGADIEVATLLARRLDPSLPVMRAIGVREISGWLSGETNREAMVERATIATRQYAKRQYSWFGNQAPPSWTRITTQLDETELIHQATILRDSLLTY